MPSVIQFQMNDPLTAEVDLMLAEWKARAIASLGPNPDPAAVAAINATTPSLYVKGRLRALALSHWREGEGPRRETLFQNDLAAKEGSF